MTGFISKPIISSQTFGERIAKIRQARELTLGEVAQKISIKESYLYAIECGHYNELPGEIYALEFAKRYARFLGVEARHVVKAFGEEKKGITDFLATAPLPRATFLKRKTLPFFTTIPWRAIGALGVACVLVAYGGMRIFDMIRPEHLEVFSPQAYYTTHDSIVSVRGRAAPSHAVYVNRSLVAAEDDGSFEATLYMPEGTTLIEITSRSGNGAPQRVWRTVAVKKSGDVAKAD